MTQSFDFVDNSKQWLITNKYFIPVMTDPIIGFLFMPKILVSDY